MTTAQTPNQPLPPHLQPTQFVYNERAVIADLFSLIEHRAEAEKRIVEEHEAESNAFATELKQRQKDIETRYENDTRHAGRDYNNAVTLARNTFEAERQEVESVATTVRSELADKAANSSDKARKGLQEGVWSAETVYEAKEHQPEQKYNNTVKRIDGAVDDIRSTLVQAQQWFRKCLQPAPAVREQSPDSPEDFTDDHATPEAVEHLADEARAILATMQTLRLPRLFAGPTPYAIIIGLAIVAAGVMFAIEAFAWSNTILWAASGGAGAGLLALIFVHFIARSALRGQFAEMHYRLDSALPLQERGLAIAQATREAEERELIEQRDSDVARAKERFEPILDEVERRHASKLESVQSKYESRMERITRQRDEALEGAEAIYKSKTADIEQRYEKEKADLEQWQQNESARIESTYRQQWEGLEQHWLEGIARCRAILNDVEAEHEQIRTPWDDPSWEQWQPPQEYRSTVRFGTMHLDMASIPGGLPQDERLAIDGATACDIPALIELPTDASLLLETKGEGRDRAIETLQTIMLRLLTSLPPGKVRFTIVDPVALGQNFAGFMHLADYEGALVGERIWTEVQQIEQRLTDLTEHMENVIQKYLRNEFETIAQYNESAGEIAEPYRFLIIADWPANFTEEATRRLMSIINSGARCGVYTLIHLDARRPLPRGVEIADLTKASSHIAIADKSIDWKDEQFGKLPLQLDHAPNEALLTRVMHAIGQNARESTHVQVPFEVITPGEGEMWSLDSRDGVRVPLGRAGATKLQYMELGRGTSQHALVAGKTGSGKSTLLHVLITNLALWYRPDEVELYLVDFKKGVEFKTYATNALPHGRVVAIESDREFGLSVLQKLDGELRRRGNIFRDLGVQGLAQYRDLNRDEPMPRILLIIDEFQEFFVEDDKIGQDASLLLDRLVRQGRAFGIHVLLGSQTLGGAYSLARTTLNQMAVRIALQCSESDSYLILNEENAAARLLSRPGEAIYNDASGMMEGNNPFQIVWLPDQTRDRKLASIRERESQEPSKVDTNQIIFEGNVPADIERNHLLTRLIDAPQWPALQPTARAWLGDAIAIKEPTVASFQRHSGANLLIVGQRDEAALAMTCAAIISLAAQHKPGTATFYVFDGAAPDDPHRTVLPDLATALPHDMNIVGYREVPEVMQQLSTEMTRRLDAHETDSPAIYILVHGLPRFRMLRASEDFGFSSFSGGSEPAPAPDKQFGEILQDGPTAGIHTIAWCDTLTNLNRTLSRQSLREFEMRVLFQMSAADSTTLIDSPQASKLGMQRALFYDEEQGAIEKFRPYALPPEGWLDEIVERWRSRG